MNLVLLANVAGHNKNVGQDMHILVPSRADTTLQVADTT